MSQSDARGGRFGCRTALSSARRSAGLRGTAPSAASWGRAAVAVLCCLVGPTATSSVAQCVLEQLVSPYPTPGNDFGQAIAWQGDELVVGGRYEAAVYVLDARGTPDDPLDDAWVLQTHLLQPQVADSFGASVAIDGDRLAVAAPDAGGGAAYPGVVHVYARLDGGRPETHSDDSWVEQAVLPAIPGTGASANFGGALALSGTRLVVGDDAAVWLAEGVLHSGLVAVYRVSDQGTPEDPRDDVWIQEALLTPDDPETAHWFGGCLQLVGPDLYVGARGTPPKGAVYWFRLDDPGTPEDLLDDVWLQQAKLEPPAGADASRFGWSVAVEGSRMLIGSNGKVFEMLRTDGGTPEQPADDAWVHASTLVSAEPMPGDRFGESVALRGGTALVGAPMHGLSFGGAAYVFRELPARGGAGATSAWTEVAKLTAPVPSDGQQRFGSAVLLAGQHAYVGEEGAFLFDAADDGIVGTVTTYAISEVPWTYLDAALSGTNPWPCLHGAGSLAPAEPVWLNLSTIGGGGAVALVAGLEAAEFPFKGGVLVPSPDVVLWLAPDAMGRLSVGAHWPPGVPSGVTLFLQAWFPDPQGPSGFAATNAVRADVPVP